MGRLLGVLHVDDPSPASVALETPRSAPPVGRLRPLKNLRHAGFVAGALVALASLRADREASAAMFAEVEASGAACWTALETRERASDPAEWEEKQSRRAVTCLLQSVLSEEDARALEGARSVNDLQQRVERLPKPARENLARSYRLAEVIVLAGSSDRELFFDETAREADIHLHGSYGEPSRPVGAALLAGLVVRGSSPESAGMPRAEKVMRILAGHETGEVILQRAWLAMLPKFGGDTALHEKLPPFKGRQLVNDIGLPEGHAPFARPSGAMPSPAPLALQLRIHQQTEAAVREHAAPCQGPFVGGDQAGSAGAAPTETSDQRGLVLSLLRKTTSNTP